MLPDADVIGFKFNIAYKDFWGHRGFSHSILFAIITGFTLALLYKRKNIFSKQGIHLTLYFTFCTASHGILDALTNGGLGVAFFSPWDTGRYFFEWRPIQVSPIGIKKFFSQWGLRVIYSEAIFIGGPFLIYTVLCFGLRKIKNQP